MTAYRTAGKKQNIVLLLPLLRFDRHGQGREAYDPAFDWASKKNIQDQKDAFFQHHRKIGLIRS